MKASELIERFESARLPQALWTHRAHLAVGLYYLRHRGPEVALWVLRERIQHLNLFHGIYTTNKGGYHETRTRVWLAVLWSRIKDATDEDLIGEYVQKDVALEHYQRATLETWEARIGWVPPDKLDLPVDPGPWCPKTPELFTFPEN